MSDFKLSVITINRNNAEGLRKTIESVLSQPNLPQEKFEYIIVDGASTDNSVDVIKEFEARTDLPLKITSWTSEPDAGIYNAMNKGIKKATGTLVGIMNSGDEFLPNAFDGLEELAENNPNAVLYGAINFITQNKFSYTYGISHEKLTSAMIPHDACFVPLEIYKEFNFYDETFKSSGDWDLFLKFYLNKVQFVYINKIISNFETGGISQTQSKLVQSENQIIEKRYAIHHFPKIKIVKKLIFLTKRIIKFSIVFALGFLTAILYNILTRKPI